jgi:tRNA1(Val) A37 N6-methylase TrmN6
MSETQIFPSERIDDLQSDGLQIIQSHEVFSFSLDAVLLARFCSVPMRGRVVDLCTGNGVIPLLLSTRSPYITIHGVEIQERLADMAQRSVKVNGLEHRIQIQCGDIKTIHQTYGHGKFDLVTVNPPYLPVPAGVQNGNEQLAIARHELLCNLQDVIQSGARLAKSGGKVAMVHRATRLSDICNVMRHYHIEPKRLRFVHAKQDQEAMMVLVEGMKDAKPDLRVLPPLIIYDHNQQWTAELDRMYQGKYSSI